MGPGYLTGIVKVGFLENIPAVIRILAVFVIILALIRKKVALGNAFIQ